ncbi:DUF4142 domain-containing protein [Pedobacter chinensis]|uniref:DUF4142 domain-containing protein n=1 Tax=Pedobacter chinensis TaxID=2282421 RepID=A0A369Q090_9SPHI|nr:DUF4142 domain-containing protein [Pedobacter chinensis]RDC57910.1 DUF4142 domain-containing protein [Pedobacter chinensis]
MKNIKSAFVLLIALSMGNGLIAAEEPIIKLKHPVFAPLQNILPPEVFMTQAMRYGMKETQMSGIAVENSSDRKIKTFAKRILDDHAAAKEELLTLAKARNITLPTSKPQGGQRPDGRIDSSPNNLQDTSRNQNQGEAGNSGQVKGVMFQGFKMLQDADVLNSVNKLTDLKGNEFDEAYIAMSIEDHRNIVALFEAGSKSSDAAVKRYSLKYLPKFKTHLAQITAMSNVK